MLLIYRYVISIAVCTRTKWNAVDSKQTFNKQRWAVNATCSTATGCRYILNDVAIAPATYLSSNTKFCRYCATASFINL